VNTTTINVADARPGQVAMVDEDCNLASITKVKRPKGADYLRITYVDDLGSVFSRKYHDTDTPWTIDIVH
jgi:translation elongation factor P/translation initiation factor 5A